MQRRNKRLIIKKKSEVSLSLSLFVSVVSGPCMSIAVEGEKTGTGKIEERIEIMLKWEHLYSQV